MPHTNPPPPEYLRLIFCRNIWFCTPEDFWQQDVEEYEMAMALLQVEWAYIEEQRKKNQPKKGGFRNFFRRGKR
jgi:hypothetical protein